MVKMVTPYISQEQFDRVFPDTTKGKTMDDIIAQAEFCLANPDVLHTPAQHRTIIQGLLDMLKTCKQDQTVPV